MLRLGTGEREDLWGDPAVAATLAGHPRNTGTHAELQYRYFLGARDTVRFARDIWLSRLKEVAARSFLPIDLFPPPLRGNVSTRESQVGMGTCEWPVVRWRLTGLHAYSL